MVQGLDILVVDDDRGIRETVGEVLEDEGYAVALAPNGAEALDLLRRGPAPALILLDLSMPVMGGAAFREAQLKDHALAEIPVILLTAAGQSAEEEGVPAAGFLRKPFGLEQLLRAVQAYCPRGVTSP